MEDLGGKMQDSTKRISCKEILGQNEREISQREAEKRILKLFKRVEMKNHCRL